MKKSHVTPWIAGCAILLFLFLLGCGGTSNPINPTPFTPQSILFSSSRALDGSNAAGPRNLWITNPVDGARPLTKLTNAPADWGTWSPDGTKIAFVSPASVDGSDAFGAASNIWVMNADGSARKALTELANAGSSAPAWSPDGKQLAFISDRALDGSDSSTETPNLWVINVDGSGLQALTQATSGIGVSDFAWSPKGKQIAYSTNAPLDVEGQLLPVLNIWVVGPDGTNAKPLTHFTAPNAQAESAAWSPDGSRIAFVSSGPLDGSDASGGAFNIWVMDADGSNRTALTRSVNSTNYSPRWSPDGLLLAFLSNRAFEGDATLSNGTANIWAMTANGGLALPVTLLTTSGADISNISWSPEGGQIAFDSARALDGSNAVNGSSEDPVSNIWLINVNGTGLAPVTKLTAPAAYSGFPKWKP